jgi:nitrogen regulatory protein PII
MKPIKRVEIIIPTVQVEAVVTKLLEAGMEDYTVTRRATGWGEREVLNDDGLTGVYENRIVLMSCPAESVEELLRSVRPIVKRYRGAVLVTDGWQAYP